MFSNPLRKVPKYFSLNFFNVKFAKYPLLYKCKAVFNTKFLVLGFNLNSNKSLNQKISELCNEALYISKCALIKNVIF